MQLQFGWLRWISWREQLSGTQENPSEKQLLDLAVILVFPMRREVVPPLEVTAPQNATARAGSSPDAVRQPHADDIMALPGRRSTTCWSSHSCMDRSLVIGSEGESKPHGFTSSRPF